MASGPDEPCNRLCKGCQSLDFGAILWYGNASWPPIRLDTSKHSAFDCLANMRESGKSCTCCRHLSARLDQEVQKKVNHPLANTRLQDFESRPIYIEPYLQQGAISVQYGIEKVLENGRLLTDYTVTAYSMLRHDSSSVPPWLDRQENGYIEDVMRPLDNDPRSGAVIQRILEWLETCKAHAICKNDGGLSLPDRLIDVGTAETPRLQLVLTRGIPSLSNLYVALSYCWGTENQFVTTRERFEQFLIAIDEDMIPQTFKDAVFLTRSLRVRYVWIDAICIMQNDQDDWEEQSAQMAKIYKDSYLTICASNAKTVHHGFLTCPRHATGKRCGLVETSHGIKTNVFMSDEPTHIHRTLETVINEEPLSARGWALQERILPHRRIFFGRSQMIWQCRAMMATESAVTTQQPTTLLASPQESADRAEIYRLWRLLVQEYMNCALSRPSDRLPAIAGLASEYGHLINDRYLAGHWKDDLPRSLLWEPLYVKRATSYRAPSWSWASVDGRLEYLDITSSVQLIAEVHDYSVQLKGLHVYGEVTDITVTLTAPVARTRIRAESLYQQTYVRPIFLENQSSEGCADPTHLTGIKYYLNFDCTNDARKFQDSGAEAFLIALGKQGSELCGLAVVATEADKNLYQRIGVFTELCDNNFENYKKSFLTLV